KIAWQLPPSLPEAESLLAGVPDGHWSRDQCSAPWPTRRSVFVLASQPRDSSGWPKRQRYALFGRGVHRPGCSAAAAVYLLADNVLRGARLSCSWAAAAILISRADGLSIYALADGGGGVSWWGCGLPRTCCWWATYSGCDVPSRTSSRRILGSAADLPASSPSVATDSGEQPSNQRLQQSLFSAAGPQEDRTRRVAGNQAAGARGAWVGSVVEALSDVFSAIWTNFIARPRPGSCAAGRGTDAKLVSNAFSSDQLMSSRPSFRTHFRLLQGVQATRMRLRTGRINAAVNAYIEQLKFDPMITECCTGLFNRRLTRSWRTLRQVWFQPLETNAGQPRCGYHHVCIGEFHSRSKSIGGMHNWFKYLLEEEKEHNTRILNCFLVGVPTDFELLLFTVVTMVNPNRDTSIQIKDYEPLHRSIATMALLRGLEEPENVGYYAVIRFTQDIAYNYHNSVKRTASIIQRSHGGHECAFLPDVQRIEGDERRLYGYGVLYFPNFDAAKYWYECTNEVRQQDWLWSADIVIVPARGAFDKGMAVLEINDWSAFRDQTAFEDEYLKGLNNTTEG
uniref:XendoU domain-containing protein n=1 Tax=Macrostomum lignano TaxID=282301 RepID=A0A1I8FH46_9PLAT